MIFIEGKDMGNVWEVQKVLKVLKAKKLTYYHLNFKSAWGTFIINSFASVHWPIN